MIAQVVQHHISAGGAEAILFVVQIGCFGIAAVAVFQCFGQVQVFIAFIIAHLGQFLVELVDHQLRFGGIGCIFCHRRNGTDNDIAVLVRTGNCDDSLLIVTGKIIIGKAAVQIVAAQQHDHAAGFHFGYRLRDGIGAGIPRKVNAGIVQQ